MNYLRFDNETNANSCRDNMNTYIGYSVQLTEFVAVKKIGSAWVVPAMPGYDYSGDGVIEVMDTSWYDEQITPKFMQWVPQGIKDSKPFHTIDLIKEVDKNFYKSNVTYDINGRPETIEYYEDDAKTNLIFTREILVSDYMNVGDSSVPNTVPDRMILQRTEKVRYVLNSGDFSDIESVKVRDYHPIDHYMERAREAKLSRENMTAMLFRDVAGFTMAGTGDTLDVVYATLYSLMRDYSASISGFTEAGDPQIATDIQNDTTYPLLNLVTPYTNDAPTIRDYCVMRITRQVIAS